MIQTTTALNLGRLKPGSFPLNFGQEYQLCYQINTAASAINIPQTSCWPKHLSAKYVHIQRFAFGWKDSSHHRRKFGNWSGKISLDHTSPRPLIKIFFPLKATAVLFAKGGSNLILLARRTEALQRVADSCKAAQKEAGVQPGKVVTVRLDVSDKGQVASLWQKVPQNLHSVDILGALSDRVFYYHPLAHWNAVNSAGYVVGREHVGDIADSDIEGMVATNVLGVFMVITK
jgi:hypothetical protein